jgi:uncharacterized protein (UPF0261 family)
MSVYVLATLDTKGHEAALVRDLLIGLGVDTRLVDVGCLGVPSVAADVSREEVFQAAGTSLEKMVTGGQRSRAVTAASDGARQLITELHSRGEVDGVLALGGSAGTTIGTAVMRALPLGLPKLMVSTLAAGQVRHFVGDKDILMLNSVVDLLGINRISRAVLSNAARAMAGMVSFREPPAVSEDRPLVAATMFGVTTPCIEQAREVLEAAGYEVMVFHATGSGGRAMEALIREGMFAGVLDITTTELADELVGGFLSAGPDRLTAAGATGVPQVVSVGACDMVNFHGRNTVPPKFRARKFHEHNPNVTLMRTTRDENEEIGAHLGRKLTAAIGPTVVVLPARGVSAIDLEGQPFDDPVARAALFAGLRRTAPDVRILELDAHINDAAFARAAAEELVELMRQHASTAAGTQHGAP